MAKKLAKNQINNLIFDHKNPKNKAQMIFDLDCVTCLCKGFLKCYNFAYEIFWIGVFI
jgi:hypothetical protein